MRAWADLTCCQYLITEACYKSCAIENRASARFAYDAADRLTAERGFDGRRIDYR